MLLGLGVGREFPRRRAAGGPSLAGVDHYFNMQQGAAPGTLYDSVGSASGTLVAGTGTVAGMWGTDSRGLTIDRLLAQRVDLSGLTGLTEMSILVVLVALEVSTVEAAVVGFDGASAHLMGFHSNNRVQSRARMTGGTVITASTSSGDPVYAANQPFTLGGIKRHSGVTLFVNGEPIVTTASAAGAEVLTHAMTKLGINNSNASASRTTICGVAVSRSVLDNEQMMNNHHFLLASLNGR